MIRPPPGPTVPVDSRAILSSAISFRAIVLVESPGRSSVLFRIPGSHHSGWSYQRCLQEGPHFRSRSQDRWDLQQLPASEKSRNDNRNYTIKIDHQLTSNHRLSGAWNDGKNTDSGPVAVLPHPISATRNGVLGPAQKTLRLSHDWVITPTVVNHLSAGHTRQYQRLEAEEQGGNWGQQLGISGLANGAFPTINIPGFLANGLGWGQNQELLVTVSNTFLLADSLSMVKGKHNLKMGFDFRKLQNNLNQCPASPATSFSTAMRLPSLLRLCEQPPGIPLPASS